MVPGVAGAPSASPSRRSGGVTTPTALAAAPQHLLVTPRCRTLATAFQRHRRHSALVATLGFVACLRTREPEEVRGRGRVRIAGRWPGRCPPLRLSPAACLAPASCSASLWTAGPGLAGPVLTGAVALLSPGTGRQAPEGEDSAPWAQCLAPGAWGTWVKSSNK